MSGTTRAIVSGQFMEAGALTRFAPWPLALSIFIHSIGSWAALVSFARTASSRLGMDLFSPSKTTLNLSIMSSYMSVSRAASIGLLFPGGVAGIVYLEQSVQQYVKVR